MFLSIFTIGLLKFTSTPSFCGSYCHEMLPEFTTWEVTSHSNISCVTCHIKPGAINLITHKMGSMLELVHHVANTYETPIAMKTEKVENEICESCHSENRESTPSGDLIIPHDRHNAKGVMCIACHAGVVHGTIAARGVAENKDDYETWNVSKAEEQTKLRYTRPRMKTCMNCHIQRKVTTACEACHTVITLPDNHTDPKWKTNHGLTARADYKACAKCHSEEDYVQTTGGDNVVGEFATKTEFCYSCHNKRPAGHTDMWLAIHKSKVLEKGRQNCIVCHSIEKVKPGSNSTETYCNKCHWFGKENAQPAQPQQLPPGTPQPPKKN